MDLQSVSSKVRPGDLFTAKKKKIDENMRLIKKELIPKLPSNTRLSYDYKTRKGTLHFPSAFFKEMGGKKEEFVVVVCGHTRRAILLANMSNVCIDMKSAIKAKKGGEQAGTVLDTVKSIEKKLDALLKNDAA